MITALFIALNWLLAQGTDLCLVCDRFGRRLCSSGLERSCSPAKAVGELPLPSTWAGLCLGQIRPDPCPQPKQLAGDLAPPRLSRSSFSCLYLYSISSGEILIGASVSKRLYIPNTNPVMKSGHPGTVMSLLSF